jgi:hypothetical protein
MNFFIDEQVLKLSIDVYPNTKSSYQKIGLER